MFSRTSSKSFIAHNIMSVGVARDPSCVFRLAHVHMCQGKHIPWSDSLPLSGENAAPEMLQKASSKDEALDVQV